MKKAKELAPSF